MKKTSHIEFWDNPLYISQEVLSNRKYQFDCEDYSILKYNLFKAALRRYNWWEKNAWRLWCNYSETLGEGHHINLAWVKGDKNDEAGAVTIESTYYPEEFQRDWHNNLWMLKQRMYKNIICFNDKEEWSI